MINEVLLEKACQYNFSVQKSKFTGNHYIHDLGDDLLVSMYFSFGRNHGLYWFKLGGGVSRPWLIEAFNHFSKMVGFDYKPRNEWNITVFQFISLLKGSEDLSVNFEFEELDSSLIADRMEDFIKSMLLVLISATKNWESLVNYVIVNGLNHYGLANAPGYFDSIFYSALLGDWPAFRKLIAKYETDPRRKEADPNYHFLSDVIDVLENDEKRNEIVHWIKSRKLLIESIDDNTPLRIDSSKDEINSNDNFEFDVGSMHWIYCVSLHKCPNLTDLLGVIGFELVEDVNSMLCELFVKPNGWYLGVTDKCLVIVRPDPFEDIVDSCRLFEVDEIIERPLSEFFFLNSILTFYQNKETDILFSLIQNQERNRATLYTSNGEFVEHRGELYPEEKRLQTDNELDNALVYLKYHFKSITGFDSPYDDRFAKLKMIKIRPKY